MLHCKKCCNPIKNTRNKILYILILLINTFARVVFKSTKSLNIIS